VVSPASVEAGQDVTVTISVTNTGELSGNYTGVLQVGDTAEATKDVTLKGGETQQVSFTVKRAQAGTYNLSIGDLNGSFTSLKPAAFTTSELTISPATTQTGEPITVTFKVTNTGQVSGTYTAVVKVNGALAGTEDIILAGGENQQVSFEVVQDQPGTYTVDVSGFSGSFDIIQDKTETASAVAASLSDSNQFNWLWLVVGVGAFLVGVILLTAMVMARRRY